MRSSPKFALILTTSILACKPSDRQNQDDVEAAKRHAQAMIKTFSTELQATLQDAIQAGGPAHAIGVCKLDAPRITAEQAVDGWTLTRTALRVRNPANAPTQWQREVLDDWAARLDSNNTTDVAELEWSTVVETAAGPELRVMKAIPLGGLCLTCHGEVEQLDAEVRTALRAEYPDDQATGFHVGDLRGAFVVTGPL